MKKEYETPSIIITVIDDFISTSGEVRLSAWLSGEDNGNGEERIIR